MVALLLWAICSMVLLYEEKNVRIVVPEQVGVVVTSGVGRTKSYRLKVVQVQRQQGGQKDCKWFY